MKPHIRGGRAFSGLTIGLLGGSFNPAHRGHVNMSLHALRRMGLDGIWWLVSPQNPLKSTQDMAPLAARVAEAQRLTATYPRITVTSIEVEMGTRYTVDTLHELQRRFPHVRFVWLMGADNLRHIHRWRDWASLFQAVPIAVFRRPGFLAGYGMGQGAQRFARGFRPAAEAGLLARKALPIWVILDNKLDYNSATRIRKDHPTWQRSRKRRP